MWGAADQGRVNYYILQTLGCDIVAFIDDTPTLASPYSDIPLLTGWLDLKSWLADQDASTLGFVIAIGNPYGHVRCRLHSQLVKAGLTPISLVDPTALLCSSSILGEGIQAMPQAIVHNDARVGRQCILNTRSLVEHDCVLEEGVEIGPGAVLCGRVHVGANSWIAAGATVRPRIHIGRNVIIGAGAVVVCDIPDNVTAVGVPARPLAGRKGAAVESES